MDQITTILFNTFMSVLAILLATAVQNFKVWLKAKTGLAGIRTAEIIVDNAVRAVEQLSKDVDVHGKRKFQEALRIARETLSSNGLNVDEDQLKMLIESSVKSMNDGWVLTHEEK